jgi:hypothetical protein
MISLTASPSDASLGRILWSHSLHHHLMHLLGFYDLAHHIITWCISWEDFVISLTASSLDASPRILWSRSLQHHLMHLLGRFCDLIHCIITNAFPGILWSRSLHHHLMHLLTNYITTWCISSLITSHLMHLLSFCDLIGCIATWCTFLYVGISAPLNKCKGEERDN